MPKIIVAAIECGDHIVVYFDKEYTAYNNDADKPTHNIGNECVDANLFIIGVPIKYERNQNESYNLYK